MEYAIVAVTIWTEVVAVAVVVVTEVCDSWIVYIYIKIIYDLQYQLFIKKKDNLGGGGAETTDWGWDLLIDDFDFEGGESSAFFITRELSELVFDDLDDFFDDTLVSSLLLFDEDLYCTRRMSDMISHAEQYIYLM